MQHDYGQYRRVDLAAVHVSSADDKPTKADCDHQQEKPARGAVKHTIRFHFLASRDLSTLRSPPFRGRRDGPPLPGRNSWVGYGATFRVLPLATPLFMRVHPSRESRLGRSPPRLRMTG